MIYTYQTNSFKIIKSTFSIYDLPHAPVIFLINLGIFNCFEISDRAENFRQTVPIYGWWGVARTARINSNPIEDIESAMILGLYVSSNLKWNDHIQEIIKKAQKRLSFLSHLKNPISAPQNYSNSTLSAFDQF